MKASQRQRKRVVVAMSGGVDSSVAAVLMKEEGHEVIGISMQLYDHSDKETRFDSCCSLKEVDSARRVAQILDIPYYVLNFENVFKEKVVDYFTREYLNARTPNPCVKCNEEVKFRHLMIKAKELNADCLVTGHYVRREHNTENGGYSLKKAKDLKKDQSYFLFSMAKSELPNVYFPLGELTKSEVRDIARKHALPTADKAESMEICFIPDNNYAAFVTKHLDETKDKKRVDGKIISRDGKTLGKHDGFYQYTIGQRRGLGLYHPDPLYVLDVDHVSGNVTVGRDADLYAEGLIAREVNWLTLPASDDISVRIRYRHKEVSAKIASDWRKAVDEKNGRLISPEITIAFEEPQRAVAPGQAAVLYAGDTLLGGGWIEQGQGHAHRH